MAWQSSLKNMEKHQQAEGSVQGCRFNPVWSLPHIATEKQEGMVVVGLLGLQQPAFGWAVLADRMAQGASLSLCAQTIAQLPQATQKS